MAGAGAGDTPMSVGASGGESPNPAASVLGVDVRVGLTMIGRDDVVIGNDVVELIESWVLESSAKLPSMPLKDPSNVLVAIKKV